MNELDLHISMWLIPEAGYWGEKANCKRIHGMMIFMRIYKYEPPLFNHSEKSVECLPGAMLCSRHQGYNIKNKT